MSYARFSDTSDVYVYMTIDGELVCCGCNLEPGGSFYAERYAQMREHLAAHVEVGDAVLQETERQLERDFGPGGRYYRP